MSPPAMSIMEVSASGGRSVNFGLLFSGMISREPCSHDLMGPAAVAFISPIVFQWFIQRGGSQLRVVRCTMMQKAEAKRKNQEHFFGARHQEWDSFADLL